MLLAVQAVGWLLPGVDDTLPKLLQLFQNLVPIVPEFIEDLLVLLTSNARGYWRNFTTRRNTEIGHIRPARKW